MVSAFEILPKYLITHCVVLEDLLQCTSLLEQAGVAFSL